MAALKYVPQHRAASLEKIKQIVALNWAEPSIVYSSVLAVNVCKLPYQAEEQWHG